MKLEPGMKLPNFELIDDSGRTRANDDFAGRGLVIYFYPKAFTPGCTTEACDFRDNHERFLDIGYEVIGVSPDPIDRLARFREEHSLPFSLLSDPSHAMAEAFGAWGVKKNYGREYLGIIRSTFVANAAGVLEHAWYNVRAKAHVDRVAREVLVE
jgi:peroxiredoxin Q/BCP